MARKKKKSAPKVTREEYKEEFQQEIGSLKGQVISNVTKADTSHSISKARG